MNAQILIDSIVQQITVLIAQLATSGGIRAPLSHVANQVFLDLARELEEQGVSRKVSADMFGMALRAYIRKVRRLGEAQSERGRTLWQAVLDFIRQEGLVSRERLLERFESDGEMQVSAVVHDLSESGLVFSSGAGRAAVYRSASDEELDRLMQLSADSGLDELAWVLIYRQGPLSDSELQALLRREQPPSELVERLLGDGRVQRTSDGKLVARDFVIPLGAAAGWEAAVFDHVQAVVQTICQRLRQASFDAELGPVVGGSTYSYDVWPGHPLERAVKSQLAEIRKSAGELRQKVDAYNQAHGLKGEYQQVITYVGQCMIERELGVEGDETGGA
jgi:hypothetical protein